MRRWEELRQEFDKRNVKLVTISPETPERLTRGHGRHNLTATMLSDRNLEITDLFGLRNQGFHSGPPQGVPGLPVPISLLVDEQGKVLWTDTSENYQQRSGPDTVLAALTAHIDEA